MERSATPSERARTMSFRRFNQSLVDDPILGYIYESPHASDISRAVQFLYNAIYYRYGVSFRGDVGSADQGIKDCAISLQRKLGTTGVCGTTADAQSVTASIMTLAKQAVITVKLNDRAMCFESNLSKKLRREHPAYAVCPPTDGFTSVMEAAISQGFAYHHYSKQLNALWNSYDREDYSAKLLQWAADFMRDSPLSIDKALGVAARLARQYHQARVANIECEPLFYTSYSGLFGDAPRGTVKRDFAESQEYDAREQLRRSGAMSPLLAAFMIDVQSHIAHETTIEMMRERTRGNYRGVTGETVKQVGDRMRRALRVLDRLDKVLWEEGLLHRVDRQQCQRHRHTIVANTMVYFAQDARRGIKR